MSDAEPRLAKNYPVNVVLVVLTLFPGLINTEALPLLRATLASGLRASPQLLEWTALLGDGALAFGVIASAALIRRLEQRAIYRALLIALFAGAALHALATNVAVFFAGEILQEGATGMLFVVALPPLVTAFPAGKLRVTVGVLVGALFGAATLGPPLGGLAARPELWRVLFGAEALVAGAAFALGLATLPERPAIAKDDPPDPAALWLPALGTVALFVGSGLLGSAGRAGAFAPWLMGTGLALYVYLLVVERGKEKPLLPVRNLESAFPLMGAIGTIVGNALYGIATVALMHHLLLVQRQTAETAGLALVPAVFAAALAGYIFSRTMPTKFVVFNAIGGFAIFTLSALGGALLARDASLVAIGAVAFGFALASGLTVTPGLFIAALSVERNLVGRAIALLELYRLAAGYAASPAYTRAVLAKTTGELATHGAPRDTAVARYLLTARLPDGVDANDAANALVAALHQGFLWTAALAAAAGIAVVLVLVLSPARLQAPDLERYVEKGEPALKSPQLTAA